MDKFVVVTDIDNCLNNLIEQMFKIYNERNGTNYTINSLKSYSLSDNFDLKTTQNMQSMFLEKELWDSLTPVEGSQLALKSFVNDGYKVYAATSTHHVNFPWKVDWMQKHFDFINPKDIICIHDKSLLRCNVLVEDCYENLIKTSAMVDRVIINHPWNKASKDRDYVYGINRADNWEDAVKCINKIYKDEMEW